jgi:hypothetical protein
MSSRFHFNIGQEIQLKYNPDSIYDEVWALGYYLSDDFETLITKYTEPVQTSPWVHDRDRYIIKIIRQ